MLVIIYKNLSNFADPTPLEVLSDSPYLMVRSGANLLNFVDYIGFLGFGES